MYHYSQETKQERAKKKKKEEENEMFNGRAENLTDFHFL